jgi:hypothetical protein
MGGEMRFVRVTSASLLCAALSFSAFAKKAPSISDEELSQITLRGRVLFQYDQAAWHSTDAVQAEHPDNKEAGRYIARKTDAGWYVAFGHLNEARDTFLIAYLAIQSSKPNEYRVQHFPAPQQDTGFYLFAARAIDIALADFQGEKRSYNVAVLPTANDQFFVYVLPAQTKTGIYPIGGDERYTISADGNTIVERRRMHKAIIEMDFSHLPGKPAGGVHGHVLSDVPEDSDVFYVLTRNPSMPEFIACGENLMYQVKEDGSITIEKK